MSLKVAIFCMVGHAIAAAVFMVLGYVWGTDLQPSLPLVPVACGLLAFLNAGRAGYLWAELN